MPVSDELFDLLARCRAIHRETGGAFDVTTHPAQPRLGIPRSGAGAARRRPAAGARGAASGMDKVALDRRPRERPLPLARHGAQLRQHRQGLRRAADRRCARARAAPATRWCRPAAAASRPWAAAPVAGRRRRARPQGARSRGSRSAARALATSGAGEQFVDVDGVRRGHVIDPRTGWPAAGVLSASVVTDDAADADALATACFVGGEAVARAWIATHPADARHPDARGRPRADLRHRQLILP